MNKTQLTHFLRNPMNRSYNQSTLRMKRYIRFKYKVEFDKLDFKTVNVEFD
jgi:hypothetical protein